jgi:hypothetical protein
VKNLFDSRNLTIAALIFSPLHREKMQILIDTAKVPSNGGEIVSI